jgi:hypothetical protein
MPLVSERKGWIIHDLAAAGKQRVGMEKRIGGQRRLTRTPKNCAPRTVDRRILVHHSSFRIPH